MKSSLDINIGRLQKEIDELALISENPAPVVTRVLFSEADLAAPLRFFAVGGGAPADGRQVFRAALQDRDRVSQPDPCYTYQLSGTAPCAANEEAGQSP